MSTEREKAPGTSPVPSQNQLAAKLADGTHSTPAYRQRTTMDGTPGMVAEYLDRRAAVTGQATRHAAPPYAGETEAALIGAAVTFAERALDPVLATGIRPEHFYVPSNRRAWDAITEQHAAGEPVDPHTIAARLGERSTVADAVVAIADTSPAHAPAWAQVIIDHAHARNMLPPLRAAVKAAQDGRTAVVYELLNAVLDAGEVANHECR